MNEAVYKEEGGETKVSYAKATGFASPALGYEEGTLDFNRLLVDNPPATVTMVCDTKKLCPLGIQPGSYLVIDRSLTPRTGNLVVFSYDGSFLCREITLYGKGSSSSRVVFSDGEQDFSPKPDEFEIVGVVKGVVWLPCASGPAQREAANGFSH
jgi:DNA polymerase V